MRGPIDQSTKHEDSMMIDLEDREDDDELMFDLESSEHEGEMVRDLEDARTSGKISSNVWYKHGPKDLDETFDWPHANFNEMEEVDATTTFTFIQTFKTGVYDNGVLLSGCFSGYATDAFAAAEIFRSFQRRLQDKTNLKLIVYSVCDL